MMPRGTRSSYQEVLVVDAEPLPEVAEHQRAVLLELEMAWHVLPVCMEGKQEVRRQIKRSDAVHERPREFVEVENERRYLLKRWLSTLILEYALKSSGMSMMGIWTWLNSFIWAGERNKK